MICEKFSLDKFIHFLQIVFQIVLSEQRQIFFSTLLDRARRYKPLCFSYPQSSSRLTQLFPFLLSGCCYTIQITSMAGGRVATGFYNLQGRLNERSYWSLGDKAKDTNAIWNVLQDGVRRWCLGDIKDKGKACVKVTSILNI